MSAVVLVLLSMALLVIAYSSYGSFIARRLGVDDARKTPAHTMYDGVDYVPAKAPVLLGHHFASIAGAGPIVGPIFAAIFGWVPVYFWLLLGGVFIGSVHDLSSIIASIRHRGKSIGEIIEDHIGLSGKKLFLIFSWSAMLLVIAVFTRIIANTFITVPATATASVLFIFLAVIFGFAIYRRNLPLGPTSLIGVILLFSCVGLGMRFPLTLPFAAWVAILMIYVWIASVTPVWILLQPRDYLNSFLLYALVAGGVIGVFFANPTINLAPLTSLKTSIGWIFPVLFVTVACGAISGFHSLVASGTTSKQLNKESDAKIVGFGGMLIEVLLAIISLMAAATLSTERFQDMWSKGLYVPIFSEGVGYFISKIPALSISHETAITFSALAVSAFALTTLDTCTRLARFAFQEFFETAKGREKSVLSSNRLIGTTVTVAMSLTFLVSGKSDAIWPIFGSANQMLAALALLAVSVWLAKRQRGNLYTLLPMFFMFAVTLTALSTLIYQNGVKGNYLLSVIASLLFVVAILLAVMAARSLMKTVPVPEPAGHEMRPVAGGLDETT
ncbi:MAG: carbon starvation protein A [candidate division KSB1 bacterium]|nr:carbon starvation protein A [candidate division KSB1 bacterium]MDZ7304123.1 carbon starvation protein A [candidate division KSB1 bacterium]MDZ7314078.1 carbon starvation protein A [candidate division KSB1 bacterium]